MSILKQGGPVGGARSAPKKEKREVPDALDIAASKPAPAVVNKFDKKQSPEKSDDYDDDFGSTDQIEEMLPDEAPEEPKLDDELGGS